MATLFDSASLVMVPSGVKEDKLYSIKPTDGTGDFTFSRDADIEATRVNASGLIEKAKTNYVLQSNTFNTTWLASNATITSGATDPNGGTTAWTLANTAPSGIIQQAVSLTGLRSVSIYAKQGTHRYLRMGVYGGTSSYANFDLQDGAVSSGTKAVMESVGGGWYRCTAWGADGTTGGVQIYPSNNATSAPTTNGNILIWRAQLNHGLVAQDYVETTTTAVVEGLTADLPRLDYHNPDSPTPNSCPSLLLEPSRTNLVEQSEYFALGGGYWGNIRCTIEDNVIVSPEGVQNASKLLQDSSTTNAGLVNRTITASGTNTFSFFAKKGTKNFARLSLYSTIETSVFFDLENGEVGTTNLIAESDCFIEDMGNDWYRCGATYSGTTNRFNIYVQDRDGEFSLLDATDAYIYIYGAQWEASSSYPTSYIPTYSEAANRGEDSASKTGISSLIGQTEGTLFYEFDLNNIIANESQYIGVVSDGTTSNRIQFLNNINNNFQVFISSTGASNINIEESTSGVGTYKVAIAYQSGDIAFYVNGVQEATSSSAIDFSTLTDFDLGQRYDDQFVLQNPMKQALVFKTRLTNAELAALTTL